MQDRVKDLRDRVTRSVIVIIAGGLLTAWSLSRGIYVTVVGWGGLTVFALARLLGTELPAYRRRHEPGVTLPPVGTDTVNRWLAERPVLSCVLWTLFVSGAVFAGPSHSIPLKISLAIVFSVPSVPVVFANRKRIARVDNTGLQQAEGERTRTTAAFGENLRAATRNCAVAMLAAGDPANEAARLAVIHAVRRSGMERYDDEWLVHDLKESNPSRVTAYLTPLNQGLDQSGKEALVRQVAAIGLADGVLTMGQTGVLETMGASVDLSTEDLRRILRTSTIPLDELAPDETPGGSLTN